MAEDKGRQPRVVSIVTFGLIIIGVAVSTLQSLVELWPAVDGATQPPKAGGAPPDQEIALLFGSIHFTTSPSTSLIVLAFLAATLGAFIHVATSFATYVGNGQLLWRWMLWYPLRLAIGASLGGIFYFVVRGGFFSNSSLTTDINPYGIASIAALVGLLSKQATDKLTNLFETLFGLPPSAGDRARGDKASEPREQVLPGQTPPDQQQPAEGGGC